MGERTDMVSENPCYKFNLLLLLAIFLANHELTTLSVTWLSQKITKFQHLLRNLEKCCKFGWCSLIFPWFHFKPFCPVCAHCKPSDEEDAMLVQRLNGDFFHMWDDVVYRFCYRLLLKSLFDGCLTIDVTVIGALIIAGKTKENWLLFDSIIGIFLLCEGLIWLMWLPNGLINVYCSNKNVDVLLPAPCSLLLAPFKILC